MTVYDKAGIRVLCGDSLNVLPELPDCSIDAVVTDPPYGLEFMGKEWDKFGTNTSHGYCEKPRITKRGSEGGATGYCGAGGTGINHFQAGPPFQEWCQRWATECLRVLKPGGHMLAFGGTRTSHRLACGIEDAGFEIRDSIAWLYGSGFPKSLDVSKAIDKAAGAERETRGLRQGAGSSRTESLGVFAPEYPATVPATPDAERWQGWGTALKPAHEPIIVARKPLAGTVASNVLTWGTGALNIDGCRINTNGETWAGNEVNAHEDYSGKVYGTFGKQYAKPSNPAGRWPANVVLTHSTDCDTTCAPGCPVAELDGREDAEPPRLADSGGASRFFYTAKADSAERVRINGVAHPTVKPLDLMRWLARLVTPPGGIILDPFAGSGTTVEACILEGFQCVAIEKEADYLPLIMQRVNRRRDPLAAVQAAKPDDAEPDLFDLLGGTDA